MPGTSDGWGTLRKVQANFSNARSVHRDPTGDSRKDNKEPYFSFLKSSNSDTPTSFEK